ncbi:MAG: nitrous oxide reductase accessory protein NosL, partial [Eudoraea sp.]|uniref:nitrous oxide reductase accessory protein NosL n=1 Tax=Eudoraea sp. TaxID=1979955 RepID=UPI003C73A04C
LGNTMKTYSILLIIFCTLLSGCNNSPKPVSNGADSCHLCKMTIVDKQHAAQFMTKKGRSYAFDAAECMLNHLNEIDRNTVALFLINDYNSPGEFIDATTASYLISQNIPSPMGEYLTAFNDQGAAEKAQAANEGEVFSWEEIQNKFKK